jgi:hypothetical protein
MLLTICFSAVAFLPREEVACGDQTEVDLKRAIEIAEELISVPEGYSVLQTRLIKSGERNVWDLYWQYKDGYLSVCVNTETGEVWRLARSYPKSNQEQFFCSREKALQVAANFAERLLPERYTQTRLDQAVDTVPPYRNIYPDSDYQFHFSRIINGLTLYENGISVWVNRSGEVTSLDVEWDDDLAAPPAESIISAEIAKDIFRQNGLELIHFRQMLPEPPGDGHIPIRLVYRLPQQQVLIDAVSGKILAGEGNFNYGAYWNLWLKGCRSGLPPFIGWIPGKAENRQKTATNGIVSEEEALEAAQRIVNLPGDVTLKKSGLSEDFHNGYFPAEKLWFFKWTGKYGNQQAMAGVSPTDGRLVTYLSLISGRQEEPKYTMDEAQELAAAYAKKVRPDRWEQVKLTASEPAPEYINQAVPPAFHFAWARLANGVPYPENGINITVNNSTGEIMFFRCNWWDLNFPQPDCAVSTAQALDRFLSERGLELRYQYVGNGKSEKLSWPHGEVKLVYSLKPGFSMLDALNGLPLNNYGDPLLPPHQVEPLIMVNGRTLVSDVPPFIENNSILVSLQGIVEVLGAGVNWNDRTKTATIHKNDIVIRLVIDGETYVNEQKADLVVPARIMYGKVMVPLRFLTESLGLTVNWDEAARKVAISGDH